MTRFLDHQPPPAQLRAAPPATTTSDGSSNQMLFIIVGAAAAVCLVVIIVSVALVRRYKAKQERGILFKDKSRSLDPFYLGPQLKTVLVSQSTCAPTNSSDVLSSTSNEYRSPLAFGGGGGADGPPPDLVTTYIPSPTHLDLRRYRVPSPRGAEAGAGGGLGGLATPDLSKSSAAETEESETDGGGASSGAERPAGKLWLSVHYGGPDSMILSATLIKAKYYLNKTKYSHNSLRDPFIRLYLLPDEKHFQISRYRGRSTNPRLNETFQFQVPLEDIRNRTLRVSFYDMDKRKVRHTLGHVLLPLHDINLESEEPVTVCRNLETATQPVVCCGDLQVSLCHMSHLERLRMVVVAARGLISAEPQPPDSYVKVQLYHGRKLLKAKKTSVIKQSAEPAFNEHFSFNVAGRQLDTLSVEFVLVTVAHRTAKSPQSSVEVPQASSSGVISRTKGTKKCYYKLILGSFMFARGAALSHWQEMTTNPRSAVIKWHPLSPI